MIVKIAAVAPKRISNDLTKKSINLLDFNGITDEMEETRKEAYMDCAKKTKGKRELQIPVCLN